MSMNEKIGIRCELWIFSLVASPSNGANLDRGPGRSEFESLCLPRLLYMVMLYKGINHVITTQ
jgi:hypothetical protein